MSIHLPTNLHEKLEFTISQYIGELHDLGIIEKEKNWYELLAFNHVTFENHIIDVLFKDLLPKYDTIQIFNQIANNNLNEEEQTELKKYFANNYKTIRWSKKKRKKWLECTPHYLYMLGYIFSKKNKSFVMTQIECVSSNQILK